MADEQIYLGVALKYPMTLSKGRGVTIAGLAVLEQAMRDILETPLGTRLFLPEYGSRCEEVKFEPNDEILEGALYMLIFEALETWETRTKFIDCTFQTKDDVCNVTIHHKPLQLNEIKSFVWPFYRKLIY